MPPVQVISAVNGPALALQTKLVTAAKEAGTIKQFMPSEFSAFGAIGEETLKATQAGRKEDVNRCLVPARAVTAAGLCALDVWKALASCWS